MSWKRKTPQARRRAAHRRERLLALFRAFAEHNAPELLERLEADSPTLVGLRKGGSILTEVWQDERTGAFHVS